MAGYTPVFSSIFDGTLHGKWPQTGVWLALLAMTDRHGCIDRTPQAIASDIGISADELLSCITQFCSPDPMSRTRDCEGRRLILIEDGRPWGWRVVNHSRYREKARLQSKDAARVESGADADRKRNTRMSPAVPRSPPLQTADSYADSNKEEEPDRSARASRSARATRLPDDFTLTAERRSIAETEKADPDREFLNFTDHWKAASGSKARKNDWDATWRIWCRRAPDFRRNGGAKDEPKLTWRPPPD